MKPIAHPLLKALAPTALDHAAFYRRLAGQAPKPAGADLLLLGAGLCAAGWTGLAALSGAAEGAAGLAAHILLLATLAAAGLLARALYRQHRTRKTLQRAHARAEEIAAGFTADCRQVSPQDTARAVELSEQLQAAISEVHREVERGLGAARKPPGRD